MNGIPGPATLAPTLVIDSDDPAVIAFARRHDATNARQRAVGLFCAVRYGRRCDPYRIDLSTAGMQASHRPGCFRAASSRSANSATCAWV